MRRAWLGPASALLCGIIFGVGLAVARMTDPEKIQNFLDLASIPRGGWDPSLAFVMGAGLLVAMIGLRLDRFMRTPLAAPAFHHGERTAIDTPLVAGAGVFGVGWGLSGFCPGPAIANLGVIPQSVYLFVLAMVGGSWIAGEIMDRSLSAAATMRAADAAAE